MGLRILQSGGNAVDAAVAATAALGVVEPMMSGIGGDLFAMLWSASDRQAHVFDGSGRSARAASLDALHARGHQSVPVSGRDGVLSVTVPGAVNAWAEILAARGTITLDAALAPAIDLATRGFPVPTEVAASWERGAATLVSPEPASGLLIGGRAPRAGEIARLPQLASTLEAIASGGPDVVYMGDLADRIIEYSSSLGGWLTHDDLREHRGEWTDPISTSYRHIELMECPPNGQGIAALVAAAILDGFDPFGVVGSPEWTHLVVEATKLGLSDAFAFLGADDGREAALACLDPDRIRDVRSGIDPARAVVPVPTVPFGAPRDTAYVAVVDEHGNGASMISSLFHGFGSGLVVPGTGVILHNRGSLFSMNPHHPSALRGRARPFHTIIPAMALSDGRLWAVFGVVGGFQQAQAHIQVLSRLVDEELAPQAALDAPRFSVDVEGDRVRLEAGAAETAVALERMGHTVELASSDEARLFGGGQLLTVAASGVVTGGSDSRRDGLVAAW
ncbi:MAG TPA: gamma-glutamyltransferase [Acidimicrobiia bacterium]|nr:gamma-glutamyltransferase [Acidimicrobiia bacterium]